MVENFLPYAFTVLHDALDSKKNAPNKAFSLLDKNIFSDLSIYLLIYSFFFLHFCKRIQQKLRYTTKARQNIEQKITEIMKDEMCAATKGA